MENESLNSQGLEGRLARKEKSLRCSLFVKMMRLVRMTPKGLNRFDEYLMNEIKEFESMYLKYTDTCVALPNSKPFLGVPKWLLNQVLEMVNLAWEQRAMWPVSGVKSDTSCTICLEGFEEEKIGHAQALGCGHIYHKRCIVQWLITVNLSCPVCLYEVPD